MGDSGNENITCAFIVHCMVVFLSITTLILTLTLTITPFMAVCVQLKIIYFLKIQLLHLLLLMTVMNLVNLTAVLIRMKKLLTATAMSQRTLEFLPLNQQVHSNHPSGPVTGLFSKRSINPWLYPVNGKLGCTTCRNVSRTFGPKRY